MNTLQKHREDLEHEEWFKAVAEKKQDQIYYLQRKLREKDIDYNSRRKVVYPTSDFANNKHVLQLRDNHNYTIQTVIR